MNFNFFLLKPIRILLFPLSLIYFAIIFLRNRMFDKGIFKSASFNLPLICVGNVAAGGTGKSPMTEYLVKELKSHFKIATLSRGYKRKTSGYALANENSTALEIGDEPMQFHLKFPDTPIAVGEARIEAIPQLLHDRPDTQAIILDDAFQHRSVKAGMNIVLTDCNNLYTRDWYLPTGDLRDEKTSVKRAQIIIITKCNPGLLPKEKEDIIREIEPAANQAMFFTSIRYGQPYHIISKKPARVSNDVEVLLVTGIANPGPLKNLLQEKSKAYYEMAYNDHHIFTIDDLKDMQKRFKSVNAPYKIILTTEKDAVRLVKFEQELADMPLYVVPIELEFLFNEGPRFNGLIGTFIKDFSKKADAEKHDNREKDLL
jgi:tetraacyldisaccharide 4'-kinase